MMGWLDNRRTTLAVVLAVLVVAVLFRFVGLGSTPLIADEAYYRLWSEHLDWSYWDHPAGIALLIYASRFLGGDTAFGMRWLNALVGVVCVLLVWALASRLFSRKAAFWAAAMVVLGAPYIVVSRLVYTDSLHMCLLLVNLYCLLPLLNWYQGRKDTIQNKQHPLLYKVWLYARWGLSLALLFNTKYGAYLYAVGLAIALFIDDRALLPKRGFLAALLLGAAGLAPVVLWNAAHEWGSLAWQLEHLVSASPGASMRGSGVLAGLVTNARHALVYLTWPLLLAGLLGLYWPRSPAERLLLLPSLVMLAPVAVSPANSPRNLLSGLVLLLILAGARLERSAESGHWYTRLSVVGGVAALVLSLAYSVGTVAGLHGIRGLPASSLVRHVTVEMGVTSALETYAPRYPEPYFTVDYSLAGKLRYVTDSDAYTSWGQYRIWGIPKLDDVTVASLDYIPEEVISSILGQAFSEVEGPDRYWVGSNDYGRSLRFWRATGLGWDQNRLLESLDFITLEAAHRHE